jgi:hypothetical protein
MNIAIMQPYLFPYLGYFQLVYASDIFVFYDDVDFIKRGWINRNQILLNGNPHGFSVPCLRPVYQKKICEVEIDYNTFSKTNFLKTIHHAYSKSPNYKMIIVLLEEFFEVEYFHIGSIAAASVRLVFDYLDISKQFYFSSKRHHQNLNFNRAERLIDIAKKEHADLYINAIGGQSLYKKSEFSNGGVELKFLEPVLSRYSQPSDDFTSGLSIIDILMMCKKDEVIKMFQEYRLV